MLKAMAAVSRVKSKRSFRVAAAKPFKGAAKRPKASRPRKTAKKKKTAKAASRARKPATSGKSRKSARKRVARKAAPIELYYWPTPNGWKVSIMLEECRLPYTLKPVNIGKGEQFAPAFLKISPNNRMPAIVDPDGPDGKPVSVFESGAILQYLGRKTGHFYPADERRRIAVDEWLFWQMANLGPMTGQANHFKNYAPDKSDYATRRYTDEVDRLFGVMEVRLRGRDYLAGSYSIADMACLGWVLSGIRLGEDMTRFPHLAGWVERLRARPAVERGLALGRELRARGNTPQEDAERRRILFGQRARL